MPNFDFPNAYEAYPVLLRDVLEFGEDQSSRIGDVREVENVMVTFTDPVKTHTPPRDGSAPLLGLLEGAQLVAGIAADDLMVELFPKYAEHSDFYGAYPRRAGAHDQLPLLFEALRTDPNTRRGVLTLWDAKLDAAGGYLDHPCTLALTFRVRNGALNMSVKMRSNDLWIGAPYDFVQFAVLQQTFATALGLTCGTYTHVADSLHIYHRDFEAAERALSKMAHPASLGRNRPMEIKPLSEKGWDYNDIQNEAAGSFLSGHKVYSTAGEDIKFRISSRLTTIQRQLS